MDTYDFNVKVKELDGTEGSRLLCTILAEFIGTEQKGHTLKLFGWLIKLQSKQPLELDEADRKTLYGMIEGTERLYLFIKGQLLEVLKEK